MRDGQIALRPPMNSEAAEKAAELGREAGLAPDEPGAAVEAAQLKAALRAKRMGGSAPVTASAGHDSPTPSDLSSGDDPASEAHWLSRLARAFTHSPVVAAR
ncbi:DUF6545 domain-containing protein [Streptomyces lydicus]|uniref:DUF6545 domain-containing protein n=1 Tax=Streptomyces lydicus TaxID=47763 RepID=UPI0036A668D6